MSSSKRAATDVYKPLPSATSIRILLLAPGALDDSGVSCWLLPCDLDRDHERFPSTTPRPVESISFAKIQLPGGESRNFPLHVDMDLDHEPEGCMHPFQRYEALSYVWGDTAAPQWITVDGELVPVTVNLYSALRSLRLPDGGRRLWVDALCINQSDPQEKKVQIGLMQRVYQQAERVIAYLPLPLQDQNNIGELVPKILQASMLCRQERERIKKEGPGQYTGVFNSVSKFHTTEVSTANSEPLSVLHAKLKKEQVFVEDFGLPPEDSPLWDSWRRLFASPYFKRIWILQEISFAKNLMLWFGNGGTSRVQELIVAHHLLDEYSGAMNMRYMASGRQLTENEEGTTLQDAITGSHSASRMFGERLVTQSENPVQQRLIEKLARVTTFQATDPRDKIYAMLGLSRDGAFFTPHVSYAESTEQVFFRFAKLFVQRGEGIEVLLQAGLRDDVDAWPSWVPHWDDLDQSVEAGVIGSPSNCPTRIQVNDKDRTLHLSGTILGEVKTLNTSILERVEVNSRGVSHTNVIRTLVGAFRMAFNTAATGDPEVLFEQLFQVVVQPEHIRKQSKPADPARTSAPERLDSDLAQPASTSSATADAVDRDVPASFEISVLRTGFHEFLKHIVTLHSSLPNLKEGVTQLVAHDNPSEWQAFLRRATHTTTHRLLCVTRTARIGVAPKRTRVGDLVARFEGCDVHFVLRRVPDSQKSKGRMRDRIMGRFKGSKEVDAAVMGGQYRFVGPAYFPGIENDAGPAARVQGIVIV